MKPGKTSLLFASAIFAAAARPSAATPRLVSPAPGTSVAPGRAARIEIGGAPSGAEEWEAFVSVDGGRTYPLRATPHLPISEPAFDWVVPALAPGALRVKVRFGVAGAEKESLLAESFSIGTGASGTVVAPDPRTIELPAAGEEGTVAWVDRSDGSVRLVVPVAGRGIVPAAAWTARVRVPLLAPRRAALARSGRAAGVRLVLPAPARARAARVGRTIASLSRLNV